MAREEKHIAILTGVSAEREQGQELRLWNMLWKTCA